MGFVDLKDYFLVSNTKYFSTLCFVTILAFCLKLVYK